MLCERSLDMVAMCRLVFIDSKKPLDQINWVKMMGISKHIGELIGRTEG